MAGAGGGARPGAGRPRKRVKHAGAISRAEKQIVDRLPEVVGRLLELADGITVQEVDPDGGERVYTRPPDREAARYLVDRIMGKPTERREEEQSGALTIRVQYADCEPDAPEAPPESSASVAGGAW